MAYMSARDLGCWIMTCQHFRHLLLEARIPYLLSRLYHPPQYQQHQEQDDDNVVHHSSATSVRFHLMDNESQIHTLLRQSLQGNTGRVIVVKKKKSSAYSPSCDEFIAYARYIEQVVCGYATLAPPLASIRLPQYSCPGRFVSVSPEHSLCRVGGDGLVSGAGGSGVASWGIGKRGQLGHGHRQDVEKPKRLLGGIGYGSIRIVQVSAGGGLVRVAHSLLLTSTGKVLSFGTGQYGALGHGYNAGKQLPDALRPQYIQALQHLTCICVSAGELHSAVVTSDGDVYTWGDGFCGQLGHGDKRPRPLPKQVTSGGLEYESVESVSCGSRHTLAVTDEGECWSWGLGHFGVLGRSFTPFDYDADTAIESFQQVAVPAPAQPVNMEVIPANAEEQEQQQEQQALPAGVASSEADRHAAIMEAAAEYVRETQAAAAFGNHEDNNEYDREQQERNQVPEAAAALISHITNLASLDSITNLSLDDSSDQCVPKVIDSLQGIRIIGASAGHRHR